MKPPCSFSRFSHISLFFRDTKIYCKYYMRNKKNKTQLKKVSREPWELGWDEIVKVNYFIDNERNLKGATSGLELAALPEFLSIVEKITTSESTDTRRGRSVLEELKEAKLSDSRAKLPLCMTPDKDRVFEFAGIAHFGCYISVSYLGNLYKMQLQVINQKVKFTDICTGSNFEDYLTAISLLHINNTIKSHTIDVVIWELLIIWYRDLINYKI